MQSFLFHKYNIELFNLLNKLANYKVVYYSFYLNLLFIIYYLYLYL